jgi:LysM repeat protein/ABC-type branched-subunit amino acid transport system substrate-binding protein
MGIKQFILSAAFIVITFLSFAQEKFEIEKKNGQDYYVYIVQQGNTVYGIKTLFKIDENDLFNANPELKNELSIGQKILVPLAKSGYKQENASDEVSENKKYHVIQKGETFYGLSRKYKVTIEELKKANPNIVELKKGESIIIPGAKGEGIQKDPTITNDVVDDNQTDETEVVENTYQWNDSIVKHKVLPHETLYSISKRYMVNLDTLKLVNGLKNNRLSKNQELIIPLKSVKVREVLVKEVPKDDTTTVVQFDQSTRKDVYTITLMLPLFLDQNASHMSKGSITSPKDILSKTKVALDFYMGFLLAIDSMKAAGLNLNVQVLDTRGDSTTSAKLLVSKNVANSDLIIGPFYNKAITPVAMFAKSHKIHMVIPFSAGNKVLFNNPYVSKFVSSNTVLINGTMEYVKSRYEGKNIVLIKSTSKKDNYSYELTRKYLTDNGVSFIEKDLSTVDMGSYFKKNELNVVLAPSANRVFVSNLFVGLNKTLNKFGYKDSTSIHLFGTDNYERFSGVKMKYKTRMNLHFAAPIYADWNSPQAIEVVSKYRAKFETDPTEYALHGFDLSMYYLSSLQLFGTGFYQYFDKTYSNPIVNRIDMRKVGSSHGYENSTHFIIRYFPDYTKELTK